MKDHYAERRKAGLCARCKEPAAAEAFCTACKALNIVARAKRTQAAKARTGVCSSCLRNPVASGKTCTQCLAYQKERRAEYRKSGRCLCGRASSEPTCAECSKRHQELERRVRDEVFNAYGGYVCNCCGETEPAFLSIDHVENNGAEHRRQVKRAGSGFYWWLRQNNFPAGFQVLCMNCNFAKGKLGACPHTRRVGLTILAA